MTKPYHVATTVELLPYNTMALSCIADRVITVCSEDQIEQVIRDNQAKKRPLLVLSGGSNVLLPESLYASVLRPMLSGIDILGEDSEHVNIEVFGGENWHGLVVQTVNNGWYGLENLALIPGLIGAAPVQNIGAYGAQLEDCLTHVRAYHIPTATWHTFNKAECQFSYRDSIFKQQTGEWLITRVGFKLHKDDTCVQASYGDVQQQAQESAALSGRPYITPHDVLTAIIAIRQRKLPDPATLPNCGSFFKNPVIATEQFVILKQRFPNVVGYAVSSDLVKVAAGWLIDHAGLKGDGIFPILTHDKQALVLTNHAVKRYPNTTNATQQDIAATQAYIQKIIYDKYAIALEREPMWINSHGQVNLNLSPD